MKMAICTEGGKDIGFGHIQRCLSLYQELNAKGIESFFIINHDEEALRQLNGGIKYFTYDWENIHECIKELTKDIEVLIIDSYKMKQERYIAFSKVVKLLICIDDLNRIEYPDGIVINGAIYAGKINYPRNKNMIYLLGTEYICLRKAFSMPFQRKTKKKVKDILLTFGGSDSKNLTSRLIELLLRNFDFDIKAIIGKGFKDVGYIEEYKKEGRVEFVFDADAQRMRDLMLTSDIAISAGGQTTYELAATGTPTIGICVADNQERNLEGWAEVGFIKYAGWYDDGQLLKKLEDYLNELGKYEARMAISELGKKYVDGKGSERVINRIVEALSHAKN